MKKQYDRYKLRAKSQMKEGLFDSYYIFIIAPKQYLDSNNEAKKYDYKISYEEILKHIKGDKFGEVLIDMAIEEKKKGYSVVENTAVTNFWKKYYELVERNYDMLNIKIHDGARGSNACWPIFSTPIKYIQIFHKSDRGVVDLTFPGLARYRLEVDDLIGEKVNEMGALLKPTGKSLSVRIKVPIISFKSDFEKQRDKVIKCLNAIKKLQELIKEIDYDRILELKNRIKK